MTQEKKQLLIKDLCTRLPYSIWGLHRGENLPLYVIDNSGAYMVLGYNAWFNLNSVEFKPYLRPMSSMTEEEEIYYNTVYFTLNFYEKEDWLLEHHFDFRGLIEKGLSLEAPEGMYD